MPAPHDRIRSRGRAESAQAPPVASAAVESPTPDRRSSRALWLTAALFLATLAAYSPAWHGGPLWDDDAHLTRMSLRSWNGLWRIWFDLGATQQYYPVVHSAFWLQHKLWGDATLGYHFVTICLHALSAGVLAVILTRLAIPGASLAAALFVLHPIHVESVAWMTELKNTLSGFFFLLSFLVYLRFDERRDSRSYALALGLFGLALLSKSVTAALPAALLVVFWWKRGSLSWRRDVTPLVPFFLCGAAAGMMTAWVERTLIGAQGSEFDFSVVERSLIAGRVVWFYLAKLLYPVNLVFTYPRWQIDAGVWWQYLFPLAAIALLVLFAVTRHRTRAPLASLLLYAGMLFPALGFFNVYPFRYSFVADHFAYLPSIPVIALIAAAAARGVERLRLSRVASIAAAVVLCVALGAMTFGQSRHYTDAESLYRHVLAGNPSSWMAHTNLGKLLIESNRDEALARFDEALRLRPNTAEARNNRGRMLHEMGRVQDAIVEYRRAIALDPALATAHNNLCVAELAVGRGEAAVAACAEAIRLLPDYSQAHFNLGRALSALGHPEALAHYRAALEFNPEFPDALNAIGTALQASGQFDEAVAYHQRALRALPSYAEAHNDLGSALDQLGRPEDALHHYREAARLNPRLALAHNNIGVALQRRGRADEAIAALQEAIRLDPAYGDAHFNLANLLQAGGRVRESVAHYEAALARNPADAAAHNNLGLALEALGRAKEAEAHFRDALRLKPDFDQARGNLVRVTGR